MITVFNTLKKGFVVNKSVDFRSRFMTLDAAKDILSRCVQVSGQTIQFDTRVWSLILGDLDAIELLERAYSLGWDSNEPNISVVGDAGYDGRVYVNNAIMQLTQGTENTSVWYSTSTAAVTSLAGFCMNTNASGFVDSSAGRKIKRVRFGKNINTTNMTDCTRFAEVTSSLSQTKYEYFDVRHLNTANVTSFNRMFCVNGEGSGYYTPYINGVENFDTGKCTDFRLMFYSLNFQNKTFDLRKWKVLSTANLDYIFGRLSQIASSGNNIKFYYRPSNWAKDPLSDSNISADQPKPVVYPYYPITVVSSAPSSMKIWINNSSLVSMSYDSSNGVCYYNPSNGYITTLRMAFFQSNNSTSNTVKSISFGDTIKNKLSSSFRQSDGTFAFLGYNTLLRTIDVTNWMQALQDMNKQTMYQLAIYEGNAANYGNRLTQIFGTEVINNVSCSHNSLVRGQQGLRFVDLGENVTTTNMNYTFRNCTNLVRITNLPAISVNITSNNPFENCTSLTTINAAGDITETISFSDSPLNLASAKVILNALKTVSGKTCTFSSTTKGYINGDTDALQLVTAARGRGWTIPLT